MSWEELWFWIESWNLSEKVREVTKEDIKAVSDNQKKAKQVSVDIQNQHKSDMFKSNLLSILIKSIDDNLLLLKAIHLYNSWFEIKNIFILFLPFVLKNCNENILCNFEIIGNLDISSISDYSLYLKNNFDFKSVISSDNTRLLDLLYSIIYYFDLSNIKSSHNSWELRQKILDWLVHEFNL